MTGPTPAGFRDVMSAFPTGVTVMCARPEGRPEGMTASAVSSVSLEPLLVLVCVERTTSMAGAVRRAGSFALSLLARDQEGLSEHFADAQRPRGPEQFDGIPWHALTTGAPVLSGAVAALDLRVWASYDGGDHDIVVGEVVDLDRPDPVPEDPLVYFRSDYTTLQRRDGTAPDHPDRDAAPGGAGRAHP